MIHKILLNLKEKITGKRSKVARAINQSKYLLVALATRTQLTVGAPGTNLVLPTIRDLSKARNRVEKYQTEVDKFEEKFADAVDEFLDSQGEQGNRLIVFIDDMDRCLPENVLIILGSLKLFLDKSTCVFIIGVESVAVEGAIQTRYGADIGSFGRDYLDKIIKLPFSIPPADAAHLSFTFGYPAGDGPIQDRERLVFEVVAEGIPRVYYRLVTAWKVISALAPAVSYDISIPEKRRLLMLATAINLRFPRLHEICRYRPDRFPNFWQWTVAPQNAGGNGSNFEVHSMTEYKEFWNDPAVRRLFQRLNRELQETPDLRLTADTEQVTAAFRLSATAPR